MEHVENQQRLSENIGTESEHIYTCTARKNVDHGNTICGLDQLESKQ